MEWELNSSPWDFTELGQENGTRLAALVGSGGSTLGVDKNGGGGGFSVDLKLGGLGDLGDGLLANKLKEPRGSTISSSHSGSSTKRARAINGTQNVSCLVDGCKADLSNCREYHRRHRVCERHSKTPVVMVGGKEKRFCQQCSRFQSLGEFDEEKRSCRKRLDGHNRRRRKPQPETIYMSSGSSWSNHQGSKLLHFGDPQVYTISAAAAVPKWPCVAKHHQDLHVSDQQSAIPKSLSCIYNGGDKRFPFLLGNDPDSSGNQAVPEVSMCQRLLNNSASTERGMGDQKILFDGLKQYPNSTRALSLLSSHPTRSLENSLSNLFQPDVIHHNQPTGTSLHFGGFAQYSRLQGTMEKSPVLVPQASEVFQAVPADLLGKRASQVLPFSWK